MPKDVKWTKNNRIASFIAHSGNILDEYRAATLTLNSESKKKIAKMVKKMNDSDVPFCSTQLPAGSGHGWFKKSADQWLGVFNALYEFYQRVPEKQPVDYLAQASGSLAKAQRIYNRAMQAPHKVDRRLANAWGHNLLATELFLNALKHTTFNMRTEIRSRSADLGDYDYES